MVKRLRGWQLEKELQQPKQKARPAGSSLATALLCLWAGTTIRWLAESALLDGAEHEALEKGDDRLKNHPMQVKGWKKYCAFVLAWGWRRVSKQGLSHDLFLGEPFAANVQLILTLTLLVIPRVPQKATLWKP